MASEYHRGDMDVSEQEHTFSSFMGMSVWFGGFTAVVVLWLALTFATGMGWMVATIVAAIVGIVMGIVLKMKAGWYATIVGLTVAAFVIGFIISLFS